MQTKEGSSLYSEEQQKDSESFLSSSSDSQNKSSSLEMPWRSLNSRKNVHFFECTHSERLSLMCTCVPGLEEIAAHEIRDKFQKLNGQWKDDENSSFSWFIHHIYCGYCDDENSQRDDSKLSSSTMSEGNREIVRIFERKDMKSMLQGKIIVQFEFNNNIESIFKTCIDALLQCISIVKVHIMAYTLENISFPSQGKSNQVASNAINSHTDLVTEQIAEDEKKEREYERRLRDDPQFRYIMEIHQQFLSKSSCWRESLLKWMHMRNLLFANKEEQQLQTIEHLKFRITAKRAGSHQFTSKELSSYIGLLISLKSIGSENAKIGQSWKADLSNYDLDIYSYLFFDTLFVCFTLCEENVCYETFSRNFRSDLLRNSTSLKPNIAYSLIQLANVREGDVFCDICCGTGIPSLMAAHLYNHHRVHVICGDYSKEVLETTIYNMNLYVGRGNERLHLMSPLLWDFTQLPLQTASVDVICSNLPFGKQIGSHSLNKEIYPPMFRQICRVLRPNGRAILLTTEKHLMQKLMSENKVFIALNKRVSINQGGSEVFVYILDRKNREWFVKNDSTK
nr:unnamed protein product [Naegleria fowleri]